VRAIFGVVLVLLVGLLPACTDDSNPPSRGAARLADSPTAIAGAADEHVALRLVELMVAERWKAFAPYFDERMKTAVPATKLAEVWAQVTSDLGPYNSHDEAIEHSDGIYRVIEIPLNFKHGTMTMRATFAPSGLVAGLYILNPS
jgi:hypothetical protein